MKVYAHWLEPFIEKTAEDIGDVVTKEQFAAIIETARRCHEANRVYCELMGDSSQEVFEKASRWQIESAVVGVTKIFLGKINGPEGSHKSWLEEKERTGWKYGPVKCEEKKEHPCFVGYDELPTSQKIKDYIFYAIAKSEAEHYARKQ